MLADSERLAQIKEYIPKNQRWSQEHKACGQGQRPSKKPRPRTALPRTDPLEAKYRNGRGQGQEPSTQAQVLSKKLTTLKIVLSSSRGQAYFRGLEALRPRPRTSNCVLEAKDVLEDSTSAKDYLSLFDDANRRLSTPTELCYGVTTLAVQAYNAVLSDSEIPIKFSASNI